MLRSDAMPKAPRAVIALLLILAGCTTTANLKAMPIKDQSPAQVESDRKRCDEWAQRTAVVLAGFAACMIAAGYETTPEVGSTSQTLRLARPSTAPEPTRVLLDVHWLSDVVAGLALGWAWFAFCSIAFGSIPRGPGRARAATVESVANA